MTDYVRNAWYMAGWSEELTDAILARRIFDRAMALFRNSDGSVSAIADRCPHRFAPLSLGDKQGETIVCRYHGLAFDGTGQCVRNPFSERIPSAARVDAWKCEERHGIIWLWGGDAAQADSSLIPDFAMADDTATVRVVRGYTLLDAPYEFGTDNLMDLSHIETVHKGSFAGNGLIYAGTHKVIDEGGTLRSNWWMPGVTAPPHTFGIYPREMVTDHWLDMRWQAPASMHLEIGACPSGAPRETGVIVHQAHILTPASATTAHYFWATTRVHDLESTDVDAFLRNLFAQAFDEEDKPIIKAAYENLEGQDFWAAKPLSLGIDSGGTRARRKLEAMITREAAET
jgi:phenylpropionate dioxygenase-like ring-hydroxylating dioxygenase large terminal subunit